MKKMLVFLVLVLLLIPGLSAQKVNVAAAANLRYVLEEIKTDYLRKHPGTSIDIIFGSSGTLVQQISNGANFDLFLAADDEFPLILQAKNLTTGSVDVYARGKLVMYSTRLPVDQKGLALLKDPGIKKIAVANPATAPYGGRTIELMKKIQVYEVLRKKIVVADNISQAAQFAFTGNTEIGFIAMSLALTPEMKGKGHYYVIPQHLYEPIEQSCVLIKRLRHNAEAARFKAYVLSPETKSIWEKWGYSVPE